MTACATKIKLPETVTVGNLFYRFRKRTFAIIWMK